MKTEPELTGTATTVRVSWSLDAGIVPGSAPDRPMPYSRSNAAYRPDRLRLTFSVLSSGARLRPFSLGSELMTGRMRQDVKADSVVLYGLRLRADGSPGTHRVTENFYGYLEQAPDWMQVIAAAALAELVNPV